MSGAPNRSPPFDGPRSQFTYRDLRRLGNYSPQSPLRVIALVDYDAFYAQCETVRLELDPKQPLAVQQWNAIIALNYAARGFGFSRGASVEDVKRLCPDIVLQHVATWREGETSWAYRSDATNPAMMKRDKAALDPYRAESRKSLKIIKNHLPPEPLQRVEKASVDEVFLDLSKQVHAILLERYPQLAVEKDQEGLLPLPPQDIILDWETDHLVDFPADNLDSHQFDWDDIALNIGSQVIRELRMEIFNRLHYTCSAGIAHNKAVAKLGAGYKKPNQQSVIRASAVGSFLSTYKMTSIRGLAGKFGAKAEKAFGSKSIADLLAISQEHMVATLGGGDGLYFYRLIRGIDHTEVVPRTDPQSMLTQKTFVPPLVDISQAASWMRMFAADLLSRLKDLEIESGCCHRPSTLVVHHHVRGRFGPTVTKQCSIPPRMKLDDEAVFDLAMNYLKAAAKDATTAWPCLSIGLALHGLVKEEQKNQQITRFMPTPQDEHDYDDDKSSRKRIKRDPTPKDFMKRSKSPLLDHADTPDNVVADGYLCPTCARTVAAANVLEHLDWHVALDLQDQP